MRCKKLLAAAMSPDSWDISALPEQIDILEKHFYGKWQTYEPDTNKCGWSLEGTEERPVYFMLQCIFTYEDKPFLGYSESVKTE